VHGGLLGAEQLLAADPFGEFLIARQPGDVRARPPAEPTRLESLFGGDALEVAAVPFQPVDGVLGRDRVCQPRLPLADCGRDDRAAVLGRPQAADRGDVVQRPVLVAVDDTDMLLVGEGQYVVRY
jgi:hypothetical protein